MQTEIYVEQLHGREIPGIMDARQFVDRAELEAEAWDLIQQRNTLHAPEVLLAERRDNARTAIMEALTASGHLSSVELTGSLDAINAQVLARLVNGWNDALPWHEKQRRFAELVNELCIQRTLAAVVRKELPPDTAVVEFSDWPEALRGSMLGYRDANKKGFTRSTHLVDNKDGTFTRVIESISRSNSGWHSTFGFLSRAGIRPDAAESPDLAALRTPAVYSFSDYQGGVVDIQRKLDESEGVNVLYGEPEGTNELHVSYEQLRDESARRESQLELYVERLAAFEERLGKALQDGYITPEEYEGQYVEELRQVLRSICLLAPEYAVDCFGEQASYTYFAASDLILQGRMAEAMWMVKINKHLEQSVTFCGLTITPERAQELGLELSDLKQLTEEAMSRWEWKQGKCRISGCPSPKPTKVGPCSVCESCQSLFNKGENPVQKYTERISDNVIPLLRNILRREKEQSVS